MRGQVEVLRAQIDSMQVELLERTRSLADLQEKIARATATVHSSDGSVEVVVDAGVAGASVKVPELGTFDATGVDGKMVFRFYEGGQ